jgi:hypothetical protein
VLLWLGLGVGVIAIVVAVWSEVVYRWRRREWERFKPGTDGWWDR